MLREALGFALKRLGIFLLNGWYVLSFGLLVFIFGPKIDQLFPVVSDAKIVDISPGSDGSVTFRYVFTKYRNCDLAAYNWVYQSGGIAGMANITRVTNRMPTTLPPGRNISSWWRLESGEPDSEYYVSLIYNCRLPWYTEAHMGPFTIRR